MKTFSLDNLELATAAVEDAKNFGLKASLKTEEGKSIVSFESIADAYGEKEEKPCCMSDVYNIMRSVASEYEYQLKWMREDINYMREALYKHTSSGHLPAIQDAGKMKEALKKLGLGDSYEVQTPTVYVQY
jgi:hypothetical protein